MKWSQPEQRRVSRFGFVPAEVGGHLKKQLTSLLSGGILEGLKPRVASQEAQLAPWCPPGLGGDILVARHQQGSQGVCRTSHPSVISHTAPWRGARGRAGGVVRGGWAGVWVGTRVAPLPAGGGRPWWWSEKEVQLELSGLIKNQTTGFLYRMKGCLSFLNRKKFVLYTLMSELDYRDTL